MTSSGTNPTDPPPGPPTTSPPGRPPGPASRDGRADGGADGRADGSADDSVDRNGNSTGTASAAWELLLPAASAPARRRGRALQSALRDAVRSGRLPAGTRLPASRELAADLGVSRGLVTEAYEQLTAESYLRAGRGSGTWVSGAVRPAARGARDLSPRAPDAQVDFRPGTPDLALFPRTAWGATHRTVLDRLPHSSLGYPDPRGLPELRRGAGVPAHQAPRCRGRC